MLRRPSELAAALAAAILTLTAAGTAQSAPAKRRQALAVDSGWQDHAGATPRVIFRHTVRVTGARWLRLFFRDTQLPAGSSLRITGLANGWTQRLDAVSLADYYNASCYFNGEALRVELIAGPGTKRNRVAIQAADVGLDPGPVLSSVCGQDDRVRSYDPRMGRLADGCSGFLVGCHVLVTSGSCFRTSRSQIVHFSTGLSSLSGSPVNAHPDDQYAVDSSSIRSLDQGVGASWAVCALRKNANTGKYPGQGQGDWMVPGTVPSSTSGARVSVRGYGVTSPRGVLNRVQQTHIGPLTAITATALRYRVDTMDGSEGSPIIDESTDRVIGIHTHDGCNTSATSSNAGTRIDRSDLVAAIAAIAPVPCPKCDSSLPSYFVPDQDAANGPCAIIPFGAEKSLGFWRNQRYQSLLTSADLCRVSGCIRDLGFAPCEQGTRQFERLVIRMAQTNATSLSANFAANMTSNVKTVLDQRNVDWHPKNRRWNRIGLTQPYCFDPSSGGPNVVVEITVYGADYLRNASPAFRIGNRERVYAAGWTTNPPASGTVQVGALKIEAVLSAPDLHIYGRGCAGSNGKVPALDLTGSAAIGQQFDVELSDALPNARTFLAVNLNRLQTPLSFAPFGAPDCLLYQQGLLLFSLTCDATGSVKVPLTVQTGTSIGLRLSFQFWPFDAQANSLGLTASNAGMLLTGR